jgi:hypothetical protein
MIIAAGHGVIFRVVTSDGGWMETRPIHLDTLYTFQELVAQQAQLMVCVLAGPWKTKRPRVQSFSGTVIVISVD